jgi:3-hydroxyisobutyrate dehydrogenase
MTSYGPRILKRDFDPGFYVDHFVKDLKIALEECEKMNIKLKGLELAYNLYNYLQEEGHGKKGTQSLILALEKMNKLDFL